MRGELGVFQRQLQHELGFFGVVFQVAFVAADLDLVQGGLGDVDVAALDQRRHLAVEQGQQQGADVGAVHVRVGHDDDAVVAQFVDVEIRTDAGAQGGDQGSDLFAGQQAVKARLFDVQDLAAQRQDGLEFTVAALFGRAAGRVALDNVEFAQGGVFFLAVGQLAGQAGTLQDALAAGHFAGFAGGLAGTGGLDDLGAQGTGIVGVFEQPGLQGAADGFFDSGADLAGDELVLGLAAELGFGDLDRQHAGQALAHVVAGGVHLGLFGQLVVGDVCVQHPGHGGAQAGQVGAAVALRDVVGETQHGFGVAVVPLHGDLDADGHAAGLGFGRHGKDVFVQDGLGAVDVLDKALDPAQKGQVLVLAGDFVHQADFHAVVQEGQLAQAPGQDLVGVFDVGEDFRVGQVLDARAGALGRAGDGQRGDPFAAAEFHVVFFAVAPDRQAQPFGQGIDAGHAHAVQTPGDLVGVLVEFAAGVQFGHDDFGGAAAVFVVLVDGRGDAAAVVGDRDAVVGVDGDDDVVAIPRQCLVDGVVHDFEDHVVQAGAVGRVADVHARPFAHGLQALEHLDRIGAVAGGG